MIALLALMLAVQQPQAAAPAPQTPPRTAAPAPQTSPGTPAPAPQSPPGTAAPTPAQAPKRPSAPASMSLQVRVTDRSGSPELGVRVTAEGPVSREGDTDESGNVQLKNVTAGTYRIRAAHDNFIALEKEVVVRAGAATSPVDFALSAAPPPPAPPPPPPAPPAPAPAPQPAAPTAAAGEPRIVSVADLAERSLSGKEPVRNVPVGCSGLDLTQLVVLRETLNSPAKPETDQMLYVVAGEGTLTMTGRDQALTSGWFALVPRGTTFTLTRKGRNPMIVLETAGGQPCSTLAAEK
jgi:mannose-6-phosphate isomerase-like protein (cupin superfamily)